MIYYKLDRNNKIEMCTSSAEIAEKLGLTLTTETEIIHGCNGQLYFKGTEPIPPEPTYQELRSLEYHLVTDQLDMIYWDQINGTNLWIEKITEIKTKYPKE